MSAHAAMVGMVTAATVPGQEPLVGQLWNEAKAQGIHEGVAIIAIFSLAEVLEKYSKAVGDPLHKTLQDLGLEAATFRRSTG